MVTSRLPWQDRWSKPTLEQLLEPLEQSQYRGFQALLDLLADMEGIESELVWYGDAWKWTLHYYLPAQSAEGRPRTVCYLVPKHEQSLVCVPMTQAMIDDLPMRRLTKFIKEGVRSAKCAIEIHWAHWNPSNNSEFNTLVDLLRRKFNFLTMETTSLAKTPRKS